MKKSNGFGTVEALGLNEAKSGQDPTDSGLPSVLIGRVVQIHDSTRALVDFPSNTSGEFLPARSLAPVTDIRPGCEVALVFEDADLTRPIIIGVIQEALSGPEFRREAQIDQETLVFSAKKEVVIKCGKASITLTSAGKLLIQGEYVVSRSSGVNKIRGGSVQIN